MPSAFPLMGSAAPGRGYGLPSEAFPDPFCDYASTAMPETIQQALRWCEYIFMSNGTYRQACDRVLSYFITDVEIAEGADESKDQWKEFLEETLDVKNTLHIVGLDALCFQGDVKAVTRDGVFKLRDLAGKTVDVLSAGGAYRPAEFKSFGTQRLLEVVLSDGRSILATPDHQWVARNCSGKDVVVPTTSLRTGYRLPRVVAPRPEKSADYYEGVRHGFTFGDGSLCKGGTRSRAVFHGAKDLELLSYFEGHGRPPREHQVDPETGPVTVLTRTVIHGLPSHYKRLPENTVSASYWYGFLCGFLAADGSVDKHGCAVLTQVNRDTLAAVEEQLPRLGMAAGPLRGHARRSQFTYKGRTRHYEGPVYYLTLLKQFMRKEDFLLARHRQNFADHYEPTTYGQFVGVKEVRETGRVEEVFCCVEMETHTFVVENAVLTRNCYGNSFTSVLPTFKRYVSCPKCHFEAPLKTAYNDKSFKFKWTNFEPHADCPKCRHTGSWGNFIDRR